MQGVPIKFRGREITRDFLVYGFYGEERGRAIIADDTGVYTVEPDSIARLVGYDDNGEEVYHFLKKGGEQIDD